MSAQRSCQPALLTASNRLELANGYWPAARVDASERRLEFAGAARHCLVPQLVAVIVEDKLWLFGGGEPVVARQLVLELAGSPAGIAESKNALLGALVVPDVEQNLPARQIESARIALTRFMKRGGKVWIRVFPDKPITAKPAETRMGSGKGAVDHYVAVVKPGRIIFEIGGVSEDVAKEAVRLASHKLPVKTRFLTRGEAESVEG